MASVVAAFSIDQVHRLTGLSISRLTAWDNNGFFLPSMAASNRHSPYSRIYSFEDVVGLRTLSILREMVSMQHLRKAAIALREHSGRPWSALTLYVLNREVHFKRPDTHEIEGAVSGQKAIPIPLTSVAEDMAQKAEKMRQRDKSKVGKIEAHKHVMGGSPVIGGTRVLVSSVQRLRGAGYSIQRIIEQYPSLTKADVKAAISSEKLTRAA